MQVKPYTFNPQPFLANKKSAMQGYVTSEPFAIEKAGHFTPKVFLLADQGFAAYSTLIETRRDLVDKKPDLVQRFVDASIIGWYNYIYGDNNAANALIKKQNPEMTDDLLAYSVAKMKEYGIVDSGDALTLGVGAMTDARMKDFFDEMVRAGVAKAELRLPQVLYAAVRRQEGRARSAAEAIANHAAATAAEVLRSSRCAASARSFPNGTRALWPGSISTSGPANSSRCSARRAAANRRRCASSPD